jgi:hypothetical protein
VAGRTEVSALRLEHPDLAPLCVKTPSRLRF